MIIETICRWSCHVRNGVMLSGDDGGSLPQWLGSAGCGVLGAPSQIAVEDYVDRAHPCPLCQNISRRSS
jgi:hypothetical protein